MLAFAAEKDLILGVGQEKQKNMQRQLAWYSFILLSMCKEESPEQRPRKEYYLYTI